MYGNAARLLYGQDMEGNQCGSGNYASKVLTAYPKMNEDIISAAQEFGGDVTALASNIDKIKFSGVCVSECPKARTWICSPSGNTTALAMQYVLRLVYMKHISTDTLSLPLGVPGLRTLHTPPARRRLTSNTAMA